MTDDFSWSGTFEEKLIPDLLIEIRETLKSGILTVRKDQIEKRIYFQNGEPMAARSNVRKDLLGELLFARGRILRAQLDEAILESKKEEDANLGEFLVGKGFLTPKELYSECKYQFISILFGIFSWDSGSYTFEEQDPENLIPEDLPRFHIKFSKLLSEGIRLIKKPGLLDRMLGDTDQVVQRTSATIPSTDLSFKGDDEKILGAVAQGKSLQEVIGSMDMEPDWAKKILYTLTCLGSLEIQTPTPEITMGTEEVPPLEDEEELPALSESSLTDFMNEILPEKKPENLPDFDDVAGAAADFDSLKDQIEEGSELLPPQIDLEMTGDFEEVSEKVDFAVDEAGIALEEEPLIDASVETEPETVPEPEEAAETFAASETQEEPVSDISEEERLLAEAWTEEAGVGEDLMEAEAAPPEPEEVAPAEQEAEPEILEEVVLEKEAEEVARIEKKSAPDHPVMDIKKKRKKRSPLVLAAMFVGLLVIIGGMSLFYFLKAKESKTLEVAQQEKLAPAKQESNQQEIDKTLPDKGEVKAPEEIIQEMAAEDVKDISQEIVPQKPEEKKTKSVQEIAAKPKEPSAEPTPSPVAKETPAPEIPVTWEDAHAKGLADFQQGNLKSAFQSWLSVLRAAPDKGYSIQIEITSYLNYASKDIQNAAKNEKVFIVQTLWNDKTAYKVLCGIYAGRDQAEEAMKSLSAYLKAQNPALVRVEVLKKRHLN